MTGYNNDLFYAVHMSQYINYGKFIIKSSPVRGEDRMRGKVRDKNLTFSSSPILRVIYDSSFFQLLGNPLSYHQILR